MKLELLCIGDLALGDDSLYHRVWEPLGGIIPGNESRILFNWELPIGSTINPIPRSRGPRLIARAQFLHVIERWAPGFATLATNHILDAGVEGLINTIESLKKMGFSTVGAGKSCEEIERPLLWETTEGNLAIINWVFPETHPDWMSVPGPNCWPGREGAKKIIDMAKGKANWVMVVAHWSDELFPYPRPEERATAWELVQMGVDLIIGHHPHVVRGLEIINSCPVFYSLGNFYFSDFSDHHGGWVVKQAPRNREGLGVLILFKQGLRPQYRVLSFWKTREQVIIDPIRRAWRRVRLVSRPLHQYRGSEYVDWHAVKHTRFFNKWSYAWHFGVWHVGLRGLARSFYSKLVHKAS